MSTLPRYIGNPVTTQELRQMIVDNWPRLSVTVEFWPGPGVRIRGATPERKFTLRTDSLIVLLSQPMTVAATGEAGICKMAAELREIFGETSLPEGLRWEELGEFAHLADMRALECDTARELPRGTSVTYRLTDIPALLAKYREQAARDTAAA